MKYLFYIINSILIAAIAYFCVEITYKKLAPEYLAPFESSFLKTASQDIKSGKIKNRQKGNQYDRIMKRNLFKVELEETKEPQKEEMEAVAVDSLKATTLKLVLWGTVTGASEIYAVIEDKKERQQSLYEIGDMVQGAKLKQILRHKVILNYQGKDQVLEMNTVNQNIQASRNPVKAAKPNEIPLNNPEIPIDISGLSKQIKIRPHFTQGEPDGLMIYGIRPNSVFKKIGLRNGDIVKEINGTPIVSAGDTSSFYTQIMEAEGDARVTLSRRGTVKELFYQVENGASAIPPFPGEESKGAE